MKNKPIFAQGDHHSSWNDTFQKIERVGLKDCVIIHVGDSAIGFYPEKTEIQKMKDLNERFKKHNIIYYNNLGNHDDKNFWEKGIDYSNFKLVKSNSVLEIEGKSVIFLGGGISLDRTVRKEGLDYWPYENFVLDESIFEHRAIDILVSHICPIKYTGLPVPKKSSFVMGWAGKDSKLLEDLEKEQKDISAAFEGLLKNNPITRSYSGHYHSSFSVNLTNAEGERCVHRGLAINEIVELT